MDEALVLEMEFPDLTVTSLSYVGPRYQEWVLQ